MNHTEQFGGSTLLLDPKKNLITFRDLQSESAHRDFDIAGKLPMSIIVPLNL